MSEERRPRSSRRPPPLPRNTEEENTDRGAAESPIRREMARRGLKDPQDSATPDETPGVDSGVAAPDDLSSTGDALVFDDKPAADAGPTFVGTIPAASADKTSIIQAEPPPEEQFPVLTIETSAGRSDVEVVREVFVIGRAPDCDVVIPDALVSRRHANLEHHGEQWLVIDQQSGNGTKLNGERVTKAVLASGDVIQVGDATITFIIPGAEPPVEAASGPKTMMLPSGGTAVGQAPALASPRRKKFLLIATALVALIGILGIVKKLTTPPPPPPGPTPQEIAARERAELEQKAQAQFEQVRRLVREDKYTEAEPLIREVAEVFPEDRTVQDFLKTVQREAGSLKLLARARELAAGGEYDEAIAALARIDPESRAAEEVEALKKECEDKKYTRQLERIKAAIEEKNCETALALSDEVLKVRPDDEVVAELKRAAEKKCQVKPVVAVGPKNPTPPPPPPPPPSGKLAGPALAAYREGNIDQALAQAPGAGASDATISDLKKLQSLLARGLELSSNPGQTEQAAKFLSEALNLDRKLGGGQGKTTEKIQNTLAKVYFVRAADAHTRKNYPEAYKYYSLALKTKPDMKPAQDRMKELETEAKNLFEAAYVFKSTQADRAIKNCKTVLQMVPAQNIYYGKCKKLLVEVEGGGDTGHGGDEGGF